MKKLLALLSGAGLAFLLSSCTDYSTGYYGSSDYSSGYNSVASVGIIRTSNSYWGYDPYRRSYYDYRSSRYYDVHNNRYCSAPPRRYTAAVYPSHYRRGHTLSCPTPIARVRSSHGSSHGHGSHASHGTQSPYGSSYGSRGSSNSRPSSSSSYRPDRISQTSGSRKSSDRGSSSGSSSSRQQTKTMPVVIHRTPSTTRSQPTLQRAPQRVQQRSTPTPSRVQSRPTVKSAPARSRSTSSPQPSNRRKVR